MVVNDYLVRDLKSGNLWDEVMVSDIKHFDGSLGSIDRIPADFATSTPPRLKSIRSGIIECARAARSGSTRRRTSTSMAGASGKKLDETYKLAWLRGLKTTYYLRTLGKSSAEKSTGRGGELNSVPVMGGAMGP